MDRVAEESRRRGDSVPELESIKTSRDVPQNVDQHKLATHGVERDITDIPSPPSPVITSAIFENRSKKSITTSNQHVSRRGSARDIQPPTSRNPGASNLDQVTPIQEPPIQPDKEKSKSTSRLRPWVLENKGSVARDHMANERTFLAWIRSAFMTLTLGIAFVQMYSISSRATSALVEDAGEQIKRRLKDENAGLDVLAKPLSIICAILAAFMVLTGYWRYLRVQHALTNNQFPATRALALTAVLLAMVVLALVIGLIIKTGP